MQFMPDSGTNITSNIAATSPEMSYQINFATTGTYYVWLRGTGHNTSSDTVHVGIKDVNGFSPTLTTGIILPSTNVFTWKSARSSGRATINIPTPGTYNFYIYGAEDGAKIDSAILTKSSTYKPL